MLGPVLPFDHGEPFGYRQAIRNFGAALEQPHRRSKPDQQTRRGQAGCARTEHHRSVPSKLIAVDELAHA